MAELDACLTRSRGSGFDSHRVWQHFYVAVDHEIFSKVILSLRLIQDGQLSFSGKRMYTSTD